MGFPKVFAYFAHRVPFGRALGGKNLNSLACYTALLLSTASAEHEKENIKNSNI